MAHPLLMKRPLRSRFCLGLRSWQIPYPAMPAPSIMMICRMISIIVPLPLVNCQAGVITQTAQKIAIKTGGKKIAFSFLLRGMICQSSITSFIFFLLLDCAVQHQPCLRG